MEIWTNTSYLKRILITENIFSTLFVGRVMSVYFVKRMAGAVRPPSPPIYMPKYPSAKQQTSNGKYKCTLISLDKSIYRMIVI